MEYNPALITVMLHPARASHTVCAFAESDMNLWFFDNDSLRRVDCKTYDDVANTVSKNAEKLVCWDVRNPTTLGLIEFHKI